MRYVKKDNEIFAYGSNQTGLYEKAISDGAVAISESEAIATTNPPLTLEQQTEVQKNFRSMAYKEESDHLYIEWQYDGTDEKEVAWREKVKEIKERYPLDA